MAQINKPNEYFNTLIWSGVDGSDRAFTGVGFQPDLTWVKSRTDAYSHVIWDSVRGSGSNKELYSDLTQSEGGTGSTATNGFLSSFDSDGFSTDNGSANTSLYFNASGKTYVGWNWLAGGTGVSNTDGSITSTVSANTTSGFSIVSYTGTGSLATVGHGLGVAPKMIIVKGRTNVNNWVIYHESIGATKYLFFDTGASGTSIATWNNTAPTSNSFTVNTSSVCNGSGVDYIAYCFAEKKGFSKFGSYTGNGTATDGTFVYTGFKPGWVLIKWTGGVEQWQIWDSKRDTYNVQQKVLAPNSSNAEDTNGSGGYLLIDSLSNGFKVRGNPVSNAINGSGQNYIYMAFASEPLVGTNNIPATAR